MNLLLITVNSNETAAVLRLFQEKTGFKPQRREIDHRTYAFLGEVNGIQVFHTISEMGSGGPGGMQQTVDRAKRALNPDAIVAVGIAFGIDSLRQAIGDVLVSTQIQCYELQKVGTTGTFVPRGDKSSASSRLVSLFKMSHVDWHSCPVRFGLILSGEKLIDNIDFRNDILELAPEAIGGEMEAAGLYVSATDNKVDWIVVKAICDWADGNKSKDKEGNQAKAAANAAEFIWHTLNAVEVSSEASAARDFSSDGASNFTLEQRKNGPPKERTPRKRSMPELLENVGPQLVEFQGGEFCNQYCYLTFSLPEVVTIPVEAEQWSTYNIIRTGKPEVSVHQYGHAGTGSRPPAEAVPLIAIKRDSVLQSLEINYDAIKDKVIGVACNPQEKAWIEKWAEDNAPQIRGCEVKIGYRIKSKADMMSFLIQNNLLEAAVDGFVFDMFYSDETTCAALREQLEGYGFKMYIVRKPL